MSKRGHYLGGHSQTYGNAQMGYLCTDPFAHLTRKSRKRKPKRKPLNPLLGRDALERYAEKQLGKGASTQEPPSKGRRGKLWRVLEKYTRRRALILSN